MSCHSQCVCHSGEEMSPYSDECVSRVWFWYQFHDALVCKFSLCSHTTKCTSTKLTVQQTQNLLNPWMWFKCLHCQPITCFCSDKEWTEMLSWRQTKPWNYCSQKSHGNLYSRMQDSCLWSHIALSNAVNFCMHSFPLPLIASYPGTSALSWNMNININLKSKELLRKFDSIYIQLQIL